MVQNPPPIRFGDLLRRSPDELTTRELAQALRISVTTVGDSIRLRAGRLPVTTSQARVLSQLSAGDSLSITTLARSQELAVSSMTESVTRLVEAGLVRKEQSPDDRRESKVTITKEGRRRLHRALEARTADLVGRLDLLDEDERRNLAAALPALWRLADLDPEIWPRVREKASPPRRRVRRPTAPGNGGSRADVGKGDL
jgi:DNA-binding MarR family transcriptional regulator